MTLRELLRTLRTGMLRDTSDRVSGDSDQLWSDAELVGYIDAAQRRFAKRSLCIRDATSPVSRFVTVAGQQDYTLDPSVFAITSMRNIGNGTWTPAQAQPGTAAVSMVYVTSPAGATPVYPDEFDLGRIGHAARRTRGYYGDFVRDGEWFADSFAQPQRIGRPRVFESDEGSADVGGSAGIISVRLTPIPDAVNANCTIQMRVARFPATRLVVENMDGVPEIPEDYHIDMLDYAAYLALRIVDHEAGDATRAAEFQASFDRHVEEARVETERRMFAPTRWGYGRNGFRYTAN